MIDLDFHISGKMNNYILREEHITPLYSSRT